VGESESYGGSSVVRDQGARCIKIHYYWCDVCCDFHAVPLDVYELAKAEETKP
jgi:hypothetical protein